MNGRVQRTLLFASLLLAALPSTPAGAGGGCHLQPPSQPTAGTAVVMERMCFTPPVLQVDPGATVRFTNEDSVVHVVVGTGWGSGEDLEPGGGTVEHRFPQPGTYAYSCYLHPGMNGAVVVGGPTAAVAGELASSSTAGSAGSPDGRFLVTGGLGAAAFGSLATSWWLRRRGSRPPADGR